MTNQDFSACVKSMQDGNMEGLKLIYEAYLPMIYHCMQDVVKNREAAEDLTSDFFVKLFHICDTFTGDTHKKWLLTIARNMAVDYVRKSSREYPSELERQEYQEEFTGVENRLSIAEAMRVLKPDEVEVVNLRLMAELTFREIAELLRVPQGTVAWKYQRALKKLRKVLGDA